MLMSSADSVVCRNVRGKPIKTILANGRRLEAMQRSLTYSSSEAKTFNDVARHEMIVKLLADIRVDLAICDIEGWDKKEYIRMLQNELNHFKL